jgi:DNA-binding response OmpR family regulator
MDTSTSPDLTYGAIRANTVRKTIQCPMCGNMFPLSIVRIDPQLRSASPGGSTPRPKLLQEGELVLNPATYDAPRAGKEIALTPRESRLLEFLMRRSGRAVSTNVLAHSVWDSNGDVDVNLIHVSFYQLRKKVDRGHKVKLIKTVRKLGYAIRDPAKAR